MPDDRDDLGKAAEKAVERLLISQGYRILARRYRAAGGEIDLVAANGAEISFCEVKARRTATGRDPAEEISVSKQARIARAARTYLQKNRLTGARASLDAALVRIDGGRMEVEIVRHAYELPPE